MEGFASCGLRFVLRGSNVNALDAEFEAPKTLQTITIFYLKNIGAIFDIRRAILAANFEFKFKQLHI